MPSDADREEVEQIAALARGVVWGVFAAASLARPWVGLTTAPSTQEAVERAAREADGLLDAFAGRFPIEEMLLP